MRSLLGLQTLALGITTRWHSSRAINAAGKMIQDTITRYNTRKRRRYGKGRLRISSDAYGRLTARISDKVANIIEHGFQGYHWGRRVLNNPQNKVLGQYPNRYMRINISKQISEKKILTVSERAISLNPNKWRMPSRSGEWYAKNAVAVRKDKIRKMLAEAFTKDIMKMLRKA